MGITSSRLVAVVVAGLLLAQCTTDEFLSSETARTGRLSNDTVLRHASTARLGVANAEIITDNDAAFRSKLEMIQNATATIDAMYYIYTTDYSSSVLSEALIEAARRGVRVRLLVDYFQNYKNLDHFSMMEREGSEGTGRLEVRFYGRPTRNMVIDAAYMTLACDEARARASAQTCHEWKSAEIERRFGGEVINGRPASEVAVSNRNVAASGLFLSGLYAKNPNIMVLAVQEGQNIDPAMFTDAGATSSAEDKDKLKEIGKIYWRARTGGPFTRLVNNTTFFLALWAFGDTLNPIYDTFREYLPVERPGNVDAVRDWEFATEFLHHKLLLVDNNKIQLGGRNVEDSYHMRPNPLTEGKYVFMDTDYVARLGDRGDDIRAAFDMLWNFQALVATIPEIRRHAPNDVAANFGDYNEATKKCENLAVGDSRTTCVDREIEARMATQAEREARHNEVMKSNADRYRADYAFRDSKDSGPQFSVDAGALTGYIENLPFLSERTDGYLRRAYGARNGQEAQYGKRIHGLWIAALKNACQNATKTSPQRVILHNAYFFPPSNLMARFGRMIDGKIDCRNVTVTVITNSIKTTDLKPVNLGARHAIKAFAEFYQAHRDPERGARFRYFEYQVPIDAPELSLHSKVSVLGGDIIVGSANADVRSYVLDSNNGVFIRNTPDLINQYLGYLDNLLGDPKRVVDRTGYFADTSREEILAEDRKTIQQELDKRGGKTLTPERRDKIEERIVQLLNQIYLLTKEVLAGGDSGEAAEEKFNKMFKLL